MNISCRKLKCEFNDKGNCRAEKIFITNEHECKQYHPIEKSNLPDPSLTMFEITPQFAPFQHNKDTSIHCNAKCLFNHNGRCNANGILVNQNTEKVKALCYTQIEE